MKRFSGWLFILLLAFLTSCSTDKNGDVITGDPDDPEQPEDTIPALTKKVNQFVADVVEEDYLWTSTIDWSAVTPLKEPDPFAFFNKLIYEADDWSMLTDDMGALTDEFQGVATTFGYDLSFFLLSYESNDVVAIINFVYPDSPAEKAGLKRGDYIIGINGSALTTENYRDLVYSSSLIVATGVVNNGELSVGEWIGMIAESMYNDPVNKDTILVKGGHKIGYLCYTDYTIESETKLIEVFLKFKAAGITDVVLDLRYNGGGTAQTSLLLSSILAPQAAVKAKDIFLSRIFNDLLTAYYKANKWDLNEYFSDEPGVNLDLSRLFVLTTRRTASASESTIVGLAPYLDVIQIGDTTLGKYCGGFLIEPTVWDSKTNTYVSDKEIANWGVYLMTYRFANKNGVSSFTGGLAPDVLIDEFDYRIYPFGDERDPLLGTAIGMITGESAFELRSAAPPVPYAKVQLPASRRPLEGKMIDVKKFSGTAKPAAE
jgi:C-terminal processing protease CtpA/Prc